MNNQSLVLQATQAQAQTSVQTQKQAQTQAIGMTQVKTKCDANVSTNKIIRTSRQFRKLCRREVIWVQYFQDQTEPRVVNILVLVLCLSGILFSLQCCSANTGISTSSRNRKNFDFVLVLTFVFMPALRPFSR